MDAKAAREPVGMERAEESTANVGSGGMAAAFSRILFQERLSDAMSLGDAQGVQWALRKAASVEPAAAPHPRRPSPMDFVMDGGAGTAASLSPLASAARAQEPDLVRILLEAGASARFADALCGSFEPLAMCARAYAAACGSGSFEPGLECARLLLAAGADPDCRGADGLRAMVLCQRRGVDDDRFVKLLLGAGASVEGAFSSAEQGLFEAVYLGGVRTVAALVEAGVDPGAARDPHGRSPKEAAADCGNREAIALFEACELRAGLAEGGSGAGPESRAGEGPCRLRI